MVLIFAPLGYVSVRLACGNDGGFRIFQTLQETGYLREKHAGGGRKCKECIEDVVRGRYEYVEQFRLKDWPSGFMPKKGIYRYSLGNVGDPRCRAFLEWNQGSDWLRPVLRRMPKGKCLQVERVISPRAKAQYSRNSGVKKGFLWVKLPFTEWVLSDVATGETLASQRNYILVRGLLPPPEGTVQYSWIDRGKRLSRKEFLAATLKST